MANKFVARKGLVSLADSEITGSLSVSQNIIVAGTITGEVTGTATTASYIAFADVDGLNSFSQSAASRLHNQELFSSSLDNTFATEAEVLSISSSLSASLAVDISGSDARLDVLEGKTLVSESIQIADDISGSLGVNAELIRSLTAVSITGSTTALSESLAGRVGAQESFSSSLDSIFATEVEVLSISSSLSSSLAVDISGSDARLNVLEGKTLVSESIQIASDISGSFGEVSSSLSGRVANLESTASSHEARLLSYETSSVLSGSAQIADDISGSLGSNATLIRSLTAAEISGSLGVNATLIRSLTAEEISGSLGANATLIRSLTAAGITGSFTSLSSSIAGDINTKLNFADTGSFAKTNINNSFGGVQTFESINVNATASFGYVQAVTGSATYIGDEYVIVNASVDGARFAGIQVYDSESNLQHTASLAWDSLNNKWIYTNASGSTYSGGGLISGPRNTGSLGEETFPTLNYVVRSQGGDHIYNSNIIDNDTTIKLGINTEVTGSLIVSSGITGALTGNASTATSASHAAAAPYSGLYGTVPTWNQNTTGNANTATSASYASNASTADSATTATSAGNADTVDSLHAASFLRSDAADTFTGKLTSGLSAGSTGLDMATNDNYVSLRVIANQVTSGINSDGMYIGYSNGNSGITRIFGGGATSGGIKVNGNGVNDVTIVDNIVWHAGNDGAGSGLDADTLDGQQGTYYYPASNPNGYITGYTETDTLATVTGRGASTSTAVTFNGAAYFAGSIGNSPSGTGVHVGISGGGDGQIQIIGASPHIDFANANSEDYDARLILTGNDTINFDGVGSSGLQVNGQTVWNAGNDGAGSGLDADLWDGNQFASYLNQAVLTSSSPTFAGLSTTGNTNLGNGNGDTTRINDILYLGASDSGDAHFYFGEDSSSWYGSYWYWDSSYTHYWYSRSAGTNTLLMYHDTRETTNVYFQRHILPTANNTYNLGSASLGWANIYTNDLHLSNMNKEEGNDIDGTRGDWTIQEGEEHLYIINNRNGKKFKIKLEEVE